MDFSQVRFIGRHIKKNNREYFSFSGSGFEFAVIPMNFTCSIELKLFSETREHDHQFIAIFINNEFHSKEKLVTGLNTRKIILTRASEINTIKIIKLNEAYLSSLYLEDIILNDALFSDVETSNRKIIGFFGDSITCGFGLIDFQGQEFKMKTEDFLKTYVYLASFSLNMDYSVVARSGISVAIPIFVDKTFGEIYDTVDMYIKCQEERQLDYAVINLGTNDNSAYYQLVKDKDKLQALELFRNKYIALVDRIFNDNPHVKVVIVYNMLPLLDEIKNAIIDVFTILNKKYKNSIELLEGIPNSDGACSHPYKTAHKENAKLLTNIIKNM